jgi:hypothetical protein
MDLENNEEIANRVSDFVLDYLDNNPEPETFFDLTSAMVSVAVAITAYRFGREKQNEMVDHYVGIVLDTYETQKEFYDPSAIGRILTKKNIH